MLKINIILLFCIIGLCSAVSAKTKETTKPKDVKEKRESAVNSGSYSYEAPQKSFQIPIHAQQQQKAAQLEYYQPAQKVAPLNHYQQKQQVAIQVQPQHQYYEVAPQQQHYEQALQHQQHYEQVPQQHYEQVSQYPSSIGFASGAENIFGSEPYKGFGGDSYKGFGGDSYKGFGGESYKGFGDFSFNYPGFESYSQMPIVHYNPESNKINSAIVSLQGLKSPASYSSYKTSPYQQSYSYGSPSPAYSFPIHSYAAPQPQHQPQQHSYAANYAASAPSGPPASSYYGFSQQPSAVFVPQTISISPKSPPKIPDYAQGSKGLGHFSTVSSLIAPSPAPTQPAYINQHYEVESHGGPSYFTQTERPFKASAFLGSSQVGHDSYSEQSIANIKPAGEYLPPSKSYLPPSKNYLPAKEQYVPAKEQHYVPEQSPVQYQIQYVQAPSKTYIPPVSNNYLPPSKISQEPPKSSYLPPKHSYLPPNNPYQQSNSFHSSQHSAPSQYQQYQPQDSYESLEYQSVTPSGHK